MPDTKTLIQTPRLILRRFKEEDLPDYAPILQDERVSKWLGTGVKKNYQDVEHLLRRFEKHWLEKNYGVWAILLKESQRIIGHCGIQDLDTEGNIELLYALHPAKFGQGYATEAAGAVIAFVKDNLPLSRLCGITYPANEDSRRVLEKLGFLYQGTREFFGMEFSYFELDLPAKR